MTSSSSDTETTDHEYLTQYTNTMHANLQFNPTPESSGCINFLSLTINRNSMHLEIDIYRKPTTTDTTIHFTSNHPNEHKLAAYRHHIERMLLLPLKTTQREREWLKILHIAPQNGFPRTITHKLGHQIEHKLTHTTPPDNKNRKWATFMYISPQIQKVTNIFRNTNFRVAFKSHNTLGYLIKPPKDHHTPPHNKWGIYQLTCNTCKQLYVGQTSRSLSICFQEHTRYIRHLNPHTPYISYRTSTNTAQ
jgi:hypothetical protein